MSRVLTDSRSQNHNTKMKLLIALTAAYATMASALCHNSPTCLIGGNDLCNWTCVREGNPSGGRCLPRDGCDGYNICACYPKSKRNNEVIEGDGTLNDVLEPLIQMIGQTDEASNNVEERSEGGAVESPVQKRSVCCSLMEPYDGLCCEGHCDWIGKPGGQCSEEGICVCN